MIYTRRPTLAVALTAFLALSACSTLPQGQAERAEANLSNDPLEPVNRVVFDVNDFLDRLLVRPMAELYRVTVPPPIRERIANVLKNMNEPIIFANSLMQGEVNQAGTTLGRLVVNSTVGVGGVFEVASDIGLAPQSADFGQTLYSWGFKDSGPYLVLPFFGPSTIRDAIGLGVDSAMEPWQYVAGAGGNAIKTRYGYAQTAASGLTKREENIEGLDSLREGSLDFYAQMRSVYLQYRAKKLGATQTGVTPTFEDYQQDDAQANFHKIQSIIKERYEVPTTPTKHHKKKK